MRVHIYLGLSVWFGAFAAMITFTDESLLGSLIGANLAVAALYVLMTIINLSKG